MKLLFLGDSITQGIGASSEENNYVSVVGKVYKTQTPFRVLKFGKVIRVPKVPFDNWLAGKEENEK